MQIAVNLLYMKEIYFHP